MPVFVNKFASCNFTWPLFPNWHWRLTTTTTSFPRPQVGIIFHLRAVRFSEQFPCVHCRLRYFGITFFYWMTSKIVPSPGVSLSLVVSPWARATISSGKMLFRFTFWLKDLGLNMVENTKKGRPLHFSINVKVAELLRPSSNYIDGMRVYLVPRACSSIEEWWMKNKAVW